MAEGWLVGWWCYEKMYLVQSRSDRIKKNNQLSTTDSGTVYLNGFGNALCLRWPGLLCMYCTPSYSSYSLPLTRSTEQHYLFSHVQWQAGSGSLHSLSLQGWAKAGLNS